MTQLLNSAFEKASLLNEIDQNIFARFILDEISSEKDWNNSFAQSEDELSTIANEALYEYKNNQTELARFFK
ncbi:MAG: hypothetical protein RBT59_06755 [Arcobacteraceae bacterium]|jgi:hypothetical protein|nr:hypothetical protein [Arcobacteraceae bacterium]